MLLIKKGNRLSIIPVEIKIANLMVGNFYIINCEEFVFNVHNNVIKDMNNEYVDEIWLMPMYRHAKEYIEGRNSEPI